MTSPPSIPSLLRVAQVVGFTSSAFLAGGIASISYIAVPSLHLSPSPILARQWSEIYSLGKGSGPWFMLFSSVAFSLLAGDAAKNPMRHGSKAFELYTAAAVLLPSIIPFTMAFMKGMNKELNAKAEDSKFGEEENVRKLIESWTRYNFARAALAFMGALLGAAAIVGM